MINKVILIGNLGQDPEIQNTQNSRVVNLSVATTESWKDKNGDWQDKTEWHRVFGFGYIADNAEKNLKKGDQVYVEGSIETNKWQDRDGNDRYTTQVKARFLRKLGRKEQSGDPGPSQSSGYDNYSTGDDVPF